MIESSSKNGKLADGSVIDRISLFGGYLSGVIIFILMVLVTVSVVSRYFFQHPLVFGEEYSGYLMVFCVYLGASYALREDAHVRVDVVIIRLTEKSQLILRVITSCLSVIYGGLLTWKTVELVIYYRETNAQAMSILETPTWIPAIIVPVGMAILTLQMIMDTAKAVRKLATLCMARVN